MHEAHLAGGPLERHSDEHCVVRIVFHKHDRDALCKHFVHAFSHAARTSMLNVLPLPGADCTRILPPIFDTPRSTIASPIPVPDTAPSSAVVRMLEKSVPGAHGLSRCPHPAPE